MDNSSVVDVIEAEVITDSEPVSRTEAERITEQVRQEINRGIDQRARVFAALQEAYASKVWRPLGYPSFAEWFQGELSPAQLRRSRDDVDAYVQMFLEAGDSVGIPAAQMALAIDVNPKTFQKKIRTTLKPVERAQLAAKPITPRKSALLSKLMEIDIDAARRGERIRQEDMPPLLGLSSQSTVSELRKQGRAIDPEYDRVMSQHLEIAHDFEPADPRDKATSSGSVSALQPAYSGGFSEVISIPDDADANLASVARALAGMAADLQVVKESIGAEGPWVDDAAYPADLAVVAGTGLTKIAADALWCLRMLGFEVPDFDETFVPRLDTEYDRTNPAWWRRARQIYAGRLQWRVSELAAQAGVEIPTAAAMRDAVDELPPERHWPPIGAVPDGQPPQLTKVGHYAY